MLAIIPIRIRTTTNRLKPKIIGDRTQNHDQVMKPVSFRAINRIVSQPRKPIPLLPDGAEPVARM
jgi:hypothetical protein